MKGKPRPLETRNKISVGNSGEKNHGWKGDDASKRAIHRWVRVHFWSTRLCQLCMQVPPVDLANITGVYNREFKNWRYACRKCHIHFDEIHVKIWVTRRKKKRN